MHRPETAAGLERAATYLPQSAWEHYLPDSAAAEAALPDSLQPAPGREYHTLQVPTIAEGLTLDPLHTRWNRHALDPTAPKPVVPDRLDPVRNGDVVQLPELPDAHSPGPRLRERTNLSGLLYLKQRDVCLATVLHVDDLETARSGKRETTDHLERFRQRDLLYSGVLEDHAVASPERLQTLVQCDPP